MGKPCKNIIYSLIFTCKCKQTELNALSVTVVITFKAIRNELCTECSFSAIELNVRWSVMREQASAAEWQVRAISPVCSHLKEAVLSHKNFWAVVEHNAAYLFRAIWFANGIVTSNKSYCYFAEVTCYVTLLHFWNCNSLQLQVTLKSNLLL